MNVPNNIDNLIFRILVNEASSEDISVFYQWIKDDNNKRYFENVKMLWVASSQKIATMQETDKFKKEQFITYLKKSKQKNRIISLFSISTVSAAAILLMFFLITETNLFSLNGMKVKKLSTSNHEIYGAEENEIKIQSEDVVLITSDGVKHIIDVDTKKGKIVTVLPSTRIDTTKELKYNTLHVPKGKRFCVKLSDSTTMWINSETTVVYPEKFAADKREVTVDGNVYFDIAKDKKRPFRVKTGTVTTEALGTTFEVDNYDKSTCKVTLLSGLVKVNNPKDNILLKPGMQAVSEEDKKSIVCNKIDVNKYGKWKDNILIIDNEPLSSVIKKLSRWHSIDIINDVPDIENIYFTGKLGNGAIEEHLKIISNNININYAIEEGKVHISL